MSGFTFSTPTESHVRENKKKARRAGFLVDEALSGLPNRTPPAAMFAA